ncbi:hypothetical protein EBU91_01340, partial [bacterium]|nr:hypothetical protein [bacterium]
MNRIEHFLRLDNRPLIVSYYTGILSAIVSSKGAEYPFIPVLDSRVTKGRYGGYTTNTTKEQNCTSQFDAVFSELESKLYSINKFETNAYSIFWSSIWDGLVSYWIGLLEYSLDIFIQIKDICEWIFSLFEPDSQELAELNAELAAIGFWVRNFDFRSLSRLTEQIELLTQMIAANYEKLQQAMEDIGRLEEQVDLLTERNNRLDALLNEIWEKTPWDEKAIASIEAEIIKVQQGLNRKKTLLSEAYKRGVQAQNILDDLLKRKAYAIKDLDAIGPLVRGWDKIKNILLKVLKKKSVLKLIAMIGAFAAALGGIITASLQIIGAVLFIAGVVVLIGMVDTFITSCSKACLSLKEALAKCVLDRQQAQVEYFDDINLLVSTGCCDIPPCKTLSGEFSSCPIGGLCGSSTGKGIGVGLLLGNKFIEYSETEAIKFCGYKEKCI